MISGSIGATPLAVANAREAEAAGGHAGAAERTADDVAKTVQLPEFHRYELAFRRNKELNCVVVDVIDGKTRTVVRTIPAEELVSALRQLPVPRGIVLDQES